MSKERPIIFSAPMVRALLAGRKTQTRRLVRNETEACAECFNAGVPHNQGDGGMGVFGSDPYLRIDYCEHNDRTGWRIRCRHGVPGDRLWVRETTWINGGYVATDSPPHAHAGKRSSLFMARRDSRITLEVTAVRVERLQDITEEDAKAEGVEPDLDCIANRCARPYFDRYMDLWNEINGPGSWQTRPWVWVVSFQPCSKLREPA